jgi:hypothetical protein
MPQNGSYNFTLPESSEIEILKHSFSPSMAKWERRKEAAS